MGEPPRCRRLTLAQTCALAHALSVLAQHRQMAAEQAARLVRVEAECAELVAELGLPDGEQIDLDRRVVIDADKREVRYHARQAKTNVPDEIVG